MVSSSLGPPLHTCFGTNRSPLANPCNKSIYPHCKLPQIRCVRRKLVEVTSSSTSNSSNSSPSHLRNFIEKSVVPFIASTAIVLSSNPASAGILSGFSGIESVPGPELPQVDFLAKFNEENQKRYAENDARFKESPLLKQLLEKSKLNKEKNRRAIQDKYCIRGAEWGVGDCSAEGMTPQERDDFIAALKKKAGVE